MPTKLAKGKGRLEIIWCSRCLPGKVHSFRTLGRRHRIHDMTGGFIAERTGPEDKKHRSATAALAKSHAEEFIYTVRITKREGKMGSSFIRKIEEARIHKSHMGGLKTYTTERGRVQTSTRKTI